MKDCIHDWQQVGVDLFKPSIKVRCVHCRAIGVILDPSRDEVTAAFYAAETAPIPFDDFQRVSSANVETLSWTK